MLLAPFFSWSAEYVDLAALMDQTNTSLEWEPVRDMGRLIRGDRSAVFKIDLGFMLLDYREKIPTEAIVLKEGSILFPRKTADRLYEHFALVEQVELAPRVAVVLIDPGHGGRDPGALGRHEGFLIKEKDVVLEVAERLFKLLKREFPEKRILTTRADDRYLELEDRTEIANNIALEANEAIIFISLHANAAFSHKAAGFEVWYLPQDYRRDLSDRSDVQDGQDEIKPILNTMLEIEFSTESAMLAKEILDALDREIGRISPNRGLKEETWFVVRNSKMPAVLIELGFVTNAEEARLLKSDEYLNSLSQAIYNGVYRFVQQFEHTKGFTE